MACRSWTARPPVQEHGELAGPRVGFAWDVTGDGRTAIRGGIGNNYDRYNDDTILALVERRRSSTR